MRTALSSAALVFVITVVFAGMPGSAQAPAAASQAISPPTAVMATYCVTCHNDRARTGDLSLEHADLSDVPASAGINPAGPSPVRHSRATTSSDLAYPTTSGSVGFGAVASATREPASSPGDRPNCSRHARIRARA